MKQNKLLWFLISLVLGLSIIATILFYKNEILKAQLYASEQSTSFLILNRNLEIFKGLKENNITRVKNNLNLYLMFGLKPIELDGIEQHLNVKSSKKLLCAKYHDVWDSFIKYNQLKYPSAMNDLTKLCQ